MKILLVNDVGGKYGGAEEHTHNLMELLVQSGYIVEIFGGDKLGSKLSLVTRFYNPFIYLKFAKRIQTFRPDIIHCHNISRNISPAVLHAARRHKVPVVMTIHDFHLICPKTWFIDRNTKPCTFGFGWRCTYQNCCTFKRGYLYFPYQWLKILKVWLHRRIIRNNVDVFISPSDILAKWLSKSLKVRKVEVIPSFIDVTKIKRAPLRDTKKILYVGRLSKEKDVGCLVKAMAKVLQQVSEAKLILIGSGPERKRLEELVNALRLSEAVKFTGYVGDEELESYYEQAEIVAIPSFWAENSPLVALESMAYGKPVVAANSFGLSEITRNDTGYLFTPGSPDDLADKLVRILTDFRVAKSMSRNARWRVEEAYSAEDYCEKIVRIYQDVGK